MPGQGKLLYLASSSPLRSTSADHTNFTKAFGSRYARSHTHTHTHTHTVAHTRRGTHTHRARHTRARTRVRDTRRWTIRKGRPTTAEPSTSPLGLLAIYSRIWQTGNDLLPNPTQLLGELRASQEKETSCCAQATEKKSLTDGPPGSYSKLSGDWNLMQLLTKVGEKNQPTNQPINPTNSLLMNREP